MWLFEFTPETGPTQRFADTTVIITATNGTVWTPADFEDFDVPGTDVGLAEDALKIVFVDTTKVYRNQFLPTPLTWRCDYYEVFVNALTPQHRARAYVSHMREVGMFTSLTLEGPLRKTVAESQHLALPEFSAAGDNFMTYAGEARSGAWGGTVVGGD